MAQTRDLASSEYTTFRSELTTIVQARYTVLSLTVAVLGVLVGLILNSSNSSVNLYFFGLVFYVKLLAPWLFFLLILPGFLITIILTIHYRRIDAYLWARYVDEQQLPFQRAYMRFREKSKFRASYTEPLAWGYFLLGFLGFMVSFLISGLSWMPTMCIQNGIFLSGETALILICILSFVLLSSKKGRKWTQKYYARWLEAISVAQNRSRRLVFLDRDGVINKNKDDGVTSLEAFEFLPHALQALANLTSHIFDLVVVTNQPYVSEGKMTEVTLNEINKKMQTQIVKNGGFIRSIQVCIHAKDSGCDCCKPKTGLFNRAASEFHIESLDGCWLIGDQESDIQAGKIIGAHTILVRSGVGKETEKYFKDKPAHEQPEIIVDDIKMAADYIIRSSDE